MAKRFLTCVKYCWIISQSKRLANTLNLIKSVVWFSSCNYLRSSNNCIWCGSMANRTFYWWIHFLIHELDRKHGNKLCKLDFFFKCSALGTKYHKSWVLEHRGRDYCLSTCLLYHFKLQRLLLVHWIAPGFANAHLRTLQPACGTYAKNFIKKSWAGSLLR